ncbi:hypothetical protein [Arhodomonas sp. AD133]|uniref:hypothetical protein n=1 Tax=Arhodomonas sp. AD133 TaxID=3415009 RepID=UPI003EBD55DA
MSELVIIQAMQSLTTRLQAVTTADGWQTDIGPAVHTGWPKHLILHQQIDPPVVAVHPSTDDRVSGQGGNIKSTRTVEIEVIASQHDTPPEWLDRALHDIRGALVGLDRDIPRVITAEAGSATWSELEDTALVRLIVPVTIDYTDHYGGPA